MASPSAVWLRNLGTAPGKWPRWLGRCHGEVSVPLAVTLVAAYYNYNKTEYESVDVTGWLTDEQLEIDGGDVPDNPVYDELPARVVPLEVDANMGRTGAVNPYRVTVSTDGAVEVEVYRSVGYVPKKSILKSSADCGNLGELLECTLLMNAP